MSLFLKFSGMTSFLILLLTIRNNVVMDQLILLKDNDGSLCSSDFTNQIPSKFGGMTPYLILVNY
jgi:hypothetical protein